MVRLEVLGNVDVAGVGSGRWDVGSFIGGIYLSEQALSDSVD